MAQGGSARSNAPDNDQLLAGTEESGPSPAAEIARLKDELRSTQAYLRIQAKVAELINSRVPMLTACRELALTVCHELEWDYAGVWTLDVKSWTLRCRDAWTRYGDALAWFEAASRAAALEPGAGLPGRAWMTARPQWATDLDSEPDALTQQEFKVLPPSAGRAGFLTALSFPLKYGDDVLAVVDVFSRARRSPDPVLLGILEAAGDQLALWELRERAEECARVAQVDADDARDQLQSVLDCAPALVVVIGPDHRISFVNRTSQHRKDEVIGKSWRDLVPTAQHELIATAIDAVFRTGKLQSYEVPTTDADGNRRWLLNHMGPILSGGTVTGAVVIAQDVTEAKLAQSELVDAQRLAAVGTLAAGVAHEINTPIQFVNDSIHFLREGSRDLFVLVEQLLKLKQVLSESELSASFSDSLQAADEAQENADIEYLTEKMPKAFDRAIEGLERVTAIVRSMKEFAHPAQKEMVPVDLNRAIRSTLTVARNEYKYVADLETCFGELPSVVCHVNDINQTVLNIIVNAAHAIQDLVRGTDKRGTIRVTTSVVGDSALITISDTGGGIPEAVRSRIFDPFFTTKEVGRGTGQGLSIARAAIREKHGGELSFETELGVGTTFFIRIPIEGKKS